MNTDKRLILVVDDDAMNREVLEAFLMLENYQVRLASGVAQAEEWLRQASPALIISDLRMPGEDGLHWCRRLKSASATRHIPVLLITGFDSDADRQASAEAGADAFLARPFGGEDLIGQVRRLLQR